MITICTKEAGTAVRPSERPVMGEPLMTEQAVEIEHHLEGIKAALAADGYRLSVAAVSPDALSLDIQALDGACPDCLVPATTMEMIIRAAIPDEARFSVVEITYPADSAAHG
jgi:Fe-S cluster biogenesis protein NfuA